MKSIELAINAVVTKVNQDYKAYKMPPEYSNQKSDFSEALKRMKQGKWVRRSTTAYSLNGNTLLRRKFVKGKMDEATNDWQPKKNPFILNSILATAWEEVEE